jgi:ubiquinone/menaquinone biosynthesis C-methylase UbiE
VKIRQISTICGLFFTNILQKSLETYQFRPFETIASIGASSGVWEIWFASQVDNLTFYLQDIDPLNCNQEEIDYGVKYYEKLLNKKIIGTFIPIIGNQYQTNLPHNYFDKILIINSLHEFLFVNKVLQDIKKCLKPSGVLFIEEQLAKTSGEIHEGCGKRLFTQKELGDCLEKNGFEVVNIIEKGNEIFIFEFISTTDFSL